MLMVCDIRICDLLSACGNVVVLFFVDTICTSCNFITVKGMNPGESMLWFE